MVIATNHGVLDVGKPTGVYASELTVPYYAFLDAGMVVDVASPDGGVIPVDPQSLKAPLRTEACDRFLADDELRSKVTESLDVGDLDMADYDIVFLAGGWGAAFDLGFSDELGRQITAANQYDRVIGGVCHGPLGLIKATAADGSPLVKGRRVSAAKPDSGIRSPTIGLSTGTLSPARTRTPHRWWLWKCSNLPLNGLRSAESRSDSCAVESAVSQIGARTPGPDTGPGHRVPGW